MRKRKSTSSPGPRTNRLFAGLTALILAAGLAGSAGIMALVSFPSDQVDSFTALPVYNVIGQRTDRVEFWPRARYHDLARATGYPIPYTPQQVLSEGRYEEMLLFLTNLCAPVNSLTGLDQDPGEMACYSYQTDNLLCRFYDDVPVLLCYGNGNDQSSYMGILNVSLGRGLSNEQSCSTVLITPASSMPAASEQQYQNAYQTILDHLMQLAGAQNSAPYLCDGPLMWALSGQWDFLNVIAFDAESQYEEDAVSSMNQSLSPFYAMVAENLATPALQELAPWSQINQTEPDREKPAEVERFLQDYFQQMYGVSLQILRQEDNYLILFQKSEHVLGLYYDPLLQTYTGFGIQ